MPELADDKYENPFSELNSKIKT